jgi:Fe-S-cluster containining protein
LQYEVDRQISTFKRRVDIDCVTHCAACCAYPDVQASALEFLPFAYHAFKLGFLDQWYEEIDQNRSPLCVFRKDHKDSWGCRIYPVRGLICRLFGFSAVTDKNNKPKFAACRIIKASKPENSLKVNEFVAKGGKIPIIPNLYRKLSAIDPGLGNEFLPINQAMKKALEIIYFNYIYSR